MKIRAELQAKVRTIVRGKVRTNCVGKFERTFVGDAACAGASLLVILKFFVPSHLNRFQLSFVR